MIEAVTVKALAFRLKNGHPVLLLSIENDNESAAIIFFSAQQVREFLERNPYSFSEEIVRAIARIAGSHLGNLPEQSPNTARRYTGIDAEWILGLTDEVENIMQGRAHVFELSSNKAEYPN